VPALPGLERTPTPPGRVAGRGASAAALRIEMGALRQRFARGAVLGLRRTWISRAIRARGPL